MKNQKEEIAKEITKKVDELNVLKIDAEQLGLVVEVSHFNPSNTKSGLKVSVTETIKY